MIARLQKAKLVARLLLERLRQGRYPQLEDVLDAAEREMRGKRFGTPLTEFRAAVPGLPIGGPDGKDIQRTFTELSDDLGLLYEGMVRLSVRAIDLYDLFAVRRDLLSHKLHQLKVKADTMLAQVAAGSRASVSDSFNTLEWTDLDRTTAFVDLDEGAVTLKIDPQASVSYDGRRIRVVRVKAPAGTRESGAPFGSVFSPYRADAWYGHLPEGSEYEVHLSVTGADYERGDTEEVLINALRIQPTGPLRLRVDWSPDGFNWHPLDPAVDTVVTDQRTFHFHPIQVGYLRLRLSGTGNVRGRPAILGIKRLELMQRGYNLAAAYYSTEWQLEQPIHTVVAELDTEVPHGTRIESYLAQNQDGPWIRIGPGPITFSTVFDQRVELAAFEAESDAHQFYLAAVRDQYVLPESGELWSGKDQVQLSAFPYDWAVSMERDHLPMREDWAEPKGTVRTGVFSARGDLGNNDATPDGYVTDRNPLAFETVENETYGVLAITQSDGKFVLQPGYNYRLRAYLLCSAPKTLEGQKIGVVNPSGSGGKAEAVVAPHSLYVNGEKVYERQNCVVTVDQLHEAFQATVPLQQGWNEIELLVQVPVDLETKRTQSDSGVASGAITLYFQPDLFSAIDPVVEELRAYREPWKKVTEFDLRYNVPLGRREHWAWKLDPENGSVQNVLFNHNPSNPPSGATDYQSGAPYFTVDGQNAGRLERLELRYTVERTDLDEDVHPRSLWFRAELSKEASTPNPPRLLSYRLIVN